MIETKRLIILSYDEIGEMTRDGFAWEGSHGVDELRFEHAARAYAPDDPNRRCVAWRDAFTKPRYFEFPGERTVIVTFDRPSFLWRDRLNQLAFRGFQVHINKSGWTTFDRG